MILDIDPYDWLSKQGLELPPIAEPVGNFQPVRRDGSLLYLSGQGPRDAAGQWQCGKVGHDVDVAAGYDHARLVGLALLASLHHELGSLLRIRRIVKILGFVNAAPDFVQHPRVIDGCSDLLCGALGEEKGRHARSAIGVGSLPGNITVEIEAVVAVDN